MAVIPSGARDLLNGILVLLPAFCLASALTPGLRAQTTGGLDTVQVQSGTLTLHALLWRPQGRGPFPAVLFNHGSYGSDDPLSPDQPAALGPVFARHGYVFLFLFRRGIGLSADQGTPDGDLMDGALRADGQEGRNRVQLQLLDSLALFLAARDTTLRAVVDFSGSAYSWRLSPELRARLLAAVGRTTAPVFFIHAANDYSVTPGKALAAEMQRLGKPHRLKIYPAVGRTAKEGHGSSSVAWPRPDVFAFLDEHLGR